MITIPTSTFFNLPPEKREKLMAAIREEFHRAPFSEISINKIIQSADIPRGSFYQYFSDKKDLLDYLMLGYRQRITDHCKKYLISHQGDLFGLFVSVLDFTIQFVCEERDNRFFKNIFADIRLNGDFNFRIRKGCVQEEVKKELLPFLNLEQLDIREPEDLNNIIGVLVALSRNATAEVFMNLAEASEVRRRFQAQIELLKRGLLKKPPDRPLYSQPCSKGEDHA